MTQLGGNTQAMVLSRDGTASFVNVERTGRVIFHERREQAWVLTTPLETVRRRGRLRSLAIVTDERLGPAQLPWHSSTDVTVSRSMREQSVRESLEYQLASGGSGSQKLGRQAQLIQIGIMAMLAMLAFLVVAAGGPQIFDQITRGLPGAAAQFLMVTA